MHTVVHTVDDFSMQASVEQELAVQEKKLNERITALETSIQGKLKKGK